MRSLIPSGGQRILLVLGLLLLVAGTGFALTDMDGVPAADPATAPNATAVEDGTMPADSPVQPTVTPDSTDDGTTTAARSPTARTSPSRTPTATASTTGRRSTTTGPIRRRSIRTRTA